MKRNKGFVSLEVIIIAAVGIVITSVLLERCLNKKVLIDRFNNNSSIEVQKDYEVLEFLREFVDIFNEEMASKDIESNEELPKDISGDNLNEVTEEDDEQVIADLEENSIELQILSNILGESGYSKNGRILKCDESNDILILIDKLINYERKCYYYDYEFIEGNIVLEKRRYYDYYK